MRIDHIAIKEEGKAFRIINRPQFDRALAGLPKGRYRLRIEKYRRNKSLSQLGYLYGVVYPMSQKLLLDAGWEIPTIEEVDVFWKTKFANQEIVNRDTGEVMNIPALKRNHTTTDMMAYTNAIRNYCAEYLNGYIPEPEEQLKIEV